MLPLVGIETGPLITSDSKSNTLLSALALATWAKLTFACRTETLGSLYSHALLTLTHLNPKIKWYMNRSSKIS